MSSVCATQRSLPSHLGLRAHIDSTTDLFADAHLFSPDPSPLPRGEDGPLLALGSAVSADAQPAILQGDGELSVGASCRVIIMRCALALLLGWSAQAAEDFSSQHARSSPAWLREGVVYEIFPRNFSAQGNFNGIMARLDELKELGVNILWLMPIHPVGEKMKKGTLGSPYAVRDFYAINRDYGTEADLKRLVSETHRRGMKVIIAMLKH